MTNSNRTSHFFNDGSGGEPKLSVYLNLVSLANLRADTTWSGHDGSLLCRQLREDGFEGIQIVGDDLPVPRLEMPYCGLDRINIPSDADIIVSKHLARGDRCLTVHAGWGLEDTDEAFALVEAILTASDKYRLPIFIETHRATITQDLWRTVQITKQFPEIRFNGDFSHYYCGQELVYGDWSTKVSFMEPILARVGFMHGRIASSGCMQVPIDADLAAKPLQAHGIFNYLDHFKELWTHAMFGFLRRAQPGDVLIFAPELLDGTYYYARLFPDMSGALVEECDRYAQALLYRKLAMSCFAEAKLLIDKQDNAVIVNGDSAK